MGLSGMCVLFIQLIRNCAHSRYVPFTMLLFSALPRQICCYGSTSVCSFKNHRKITNLPQVFKNQDPETEAISQGIFLRECSIKFHC